MPLAFFFPFALSAAATCFWLLFYFYYSPRFTTSRVVLFWLFVGGVLAAGGVYIVEREVFRFLPESLLAVLSGRKFQVDTLAGTFPLIFVMFFVVAPIEELAKFAILKGMIRLRPNDMNQIIDGIKYGLVVGLGFVSVENVIYFRYAFDSENFLIVVQTVFLRFFTATLAHSLYSGMMGYFLGLASFYRLYSDRFLKRGIFAAIILHGLYNTLLYTAVSFYSIATIIIILVVLLKWYSDRRYLEARIVRGEHEVILPPFLSDRPEFESILAKNQVSYSLIKTLRLCPFCLRRDTIVDGTCGYCGRKVERGE